uniref:Tyrosinase copper-binding domain-containing protein n=1 Tax=Romanomermis culicivorax TaxID=13658 RepID=A0A915JK17_ROMCU
MSYVAFISLLPILITSSLVRLNLCDEKSLLLYFGKLRQPENGECFPNRSALLQRLSVEMLELSCQKWRQYNEEINVTKSLTATNSIFTENQINYLKSLSTDLKANFNKRTNYISVRKEIRSMSYDERSKFFDTVRKLKTEEKVDGVSKYDLLVYLRHPHLAPASQMGASFLPWHREYLRRFEVALQQIDLNVFLPFWNPEIDSSLPNPADSLLWSALYVGTGRGSIKTGSFSNWTFATKLDENSQIVYEPLQRNLRKASRWISSGQSPNGNDARYILSRKKFEDFSVCSGSKIEIISRKVHDWIGGTMADLPRSPRDPLYFLYHAYLDYLYETWRRFKSYLERTKNYPKGSKACAKYHQGDAPMWPFLDTSFRNIDGLSDIYTQIYYTYQNEPVCGKSDDQCLSNHLFCDKKDAKCLSKIRLGGNCSSPESCFLSKCTGGICS